MGCKLKKMNLNEILYDLYDKAVEHVQKVIHQHGILLDFTCESMLLVRGRQRLTFIKNPLDYVKYTESQWDAAYGSIIKFKCVVKEFLSIKPNSFVRQCMRSVFWKFDFHRFNQDLWVVN